MRKKLNKKPSKPIKTSKKIQSKKSSPSSKPSRFQREKKPATKTSSIENRKNELRDNEDEKIPPKKKNRYPFEDEEDAEEIEAKDEHDEDEDEKYDEDDEETEEDDERSDEENDDEDSFQFDKDENNLNNKNGKSPFIVVHPELSDHDPYTNQDRVIDKKAQKQNKAAFYRQTEEIVSDISSSIGQKISKILLESITKVK